MSDLIKRQDAIDCFWGEDRMMRDALDIIKDVRNLPSAEPTLREKALLLLLNWAEECGFGYDSMPEEYEMYKEDIKNMGYIEGLIYIAEREVERDE